jgi:predicted anti-sigma-YlaC factor YlaD
MPVASDYPGMQCHDARSLLSASLDGEASAAEEAALGDHLRTCAGCRAFASDADALHRLVRVTPAADVPDLTAAILRSTAAGETDRSGGRRLRLALVAVALVQVLLALPGVFATAEHTSHLAAFDLALAAGFVWVAARPARALSGFLPVGTVLVVVCAGLALADTVRGHGETLRIATHSLAVLGLTAAWLLEAQSHRDPANPADPALAA